MQRNPINPEYRGGMEITVIEIPLDKFDVTILSKPNNLNRSESHVLFMKG